MSDNALIELLHDAVGEPPRVVDSAVVRRRGRRQRRNRGILAGVTVVAVVALGVWVPHALDRGGRAAPASPISTWTPQPLHQIQACITADDIHSTVKPRADATITTVVTCERRIVARPGQGLWMQQIENATTDGVTAYAHALAVEPPRNPCSDVVASIGLIDQDGHTYHGYGAYCTDDPVGNAYKALKFHIVATAWMGQVGSEFDARSACAAGWLGNDPGLMDDFLVGFPNSAVMTASETTTLICGIRIPAAGETNPPYYLVKATPTVAADRARATAALDALPGVAANSDQHPRACTTPASEYVWTLTTGGRTVGYLGLGPCLRGVEPDLHTTSPELQRVANNVWVILRIQLDIQKARNR